MKKIKEYKSVMNDKVGIRINGNESYKNIEKNELDEIIKEIKKINFNRYPDDESLNLRKAYAEVVGIGEENVIAGNGSDEMISLIINYQITKKKGVVKKYNTENDGSFSVDRFIEYGRKVNPNLIIFSNPNNPTGHVISNDEIIFILEAFKDILIVVDEAYYEFYGQGMIGYIEKYKNLIVTRTLSKAWGLAALRIGFLIANKHLINKLRINKTPYNLNTFSQMVGCVVLKHP